jgi:hypothetical protein
MKYDDEVRALRTPERKFLARDLPRARKLRDAARRRENGSLRDE